MWEKMFLLLLHSVEAVVASQCWQGATFSEAVVVSPAVEGSGILRVPGVSSLLECVAACCDLPGYDLAWLFQGRCYVLSCRQRESCRPRERPGADSFLAFLRRASPQTLVLQSLVRGEPYAGRWRPFLQPSEAPGDLEALKDLALFDGPRQDFSDPGTLDVEDPEGSQKERDGHGSEAWTTTVQPSLKGGDGSNHSEAADSPETGGTETSGAQNRASSGGNVSQGGKGETRRPTDPAGKHTTEPQGGADATSPTLPPLQKPTAVSTRQDPGRTSLPPPATPLPDRPLVMSPGNPVEQPDRPLVVSPGNPVEQPDRPLVASPGNPVERTLPTIKLNAAVSPEPTTDLQKLLQSAATASTPHPKERAVTSDLITPHPPERALTSDPITPAAPCTNPPVVTTPSGKGTHRADAEAGGSTRGPVAVVGPDRELLLPVSSLSLDGSGSSADRGGIAGYRWDAVSGPPGIKLEGADRAVAMATGFRVGRYTFRLTVWDQQGATDSASLTVRVQEAGSLPPVAHGSGSHTLSLPNNSLVLRGSVTNGDQAQVRYLWVRDSQSPAAGDVLYGSETQASLYLANLVEGTYLFQLRVTDAQGRSSSATGTVEVRPEPGGGDAVELEMLVPVSQVSVAQRDTVVRQLAALLHVLDGDIQVQALQGHSHLSTVLRFSVRGPSGPTPASRLVGLLRNQLLREKSDYLLFRVLRVDTVVCLLRCSDHGQCDPITKECACDPFWTENLFRRYLGDGESNCEWRVLYVILTSFLLVVVILSVSWTVICCCKRRRQNKVRKKTRYTILDNMDEQERVELRPKFSIKHRSTEHNSSLMMSESELDSDQDTVFSRARPVRSRNRTSGQAARNGNAFG